MSKRDERQFEAKIREITKPLNGQYPRPWMTDLRDPLLAEVFVVGKNQRNGYPTDAVSHERHVAALFNEEPGACRRLYCELTGGKPSPTRKNIDRLVAMLKDIGVDRVLETNVICYSTPMSVDLRHEFHIVGAKRGEAIFRFLLTSIEPKVLIVSGSGATKKLRTILNCNLPDPPNCAEDGLVLCRCGAMLVIVIPSLAPPAYNKWSSWAPAHLAQVANAVADHFSG